MSSTPGDAQASDRTARARIRDAAITCFARDGFKVSVRAIAAQAGVSAGLVIHHFGSKDGLRKECDDHIRTMIGAIKNQGVSGSREENSDFFMRSMANLSAMNEPFRYMLQSLKSGNKFAAEFIHSYAETFEESLALGTQNGTLKPSVDPKARAEMLTYMSAGMFLLLASSGELGDLADPNFIPTYMDRYGLVLFELYAQGLTTDSSIFDIYKNSREHDKK